MSSSEQTDSQYGYVPTKIVQIVFLSLFGVTAIAHLGQALRSKMWWLLPTFFICGFLEMLTYGARLWSSYNPSVSMLYSTQLVVALIAPTHFIAGSFIILRNMMDVLGVGYSRLSPKWYRYIFNGGAIVSITVQGGSGGFATFKSKPVLAKIGKYMAVGGTILQTVVITVFLIFTIDYLMHYNNDRPFRTARAKLNAEPEALLSADHAGGSLRGYMDRRLHRMSAAVVFSTVCLVVRGIYRIIEQVRNVQGKPQSQIYFAIFDGAMVFLAMIAYNVAHPYDLIPASPVKQGTPSVSSDRTHYQLAGM